LNVSPLHLGGFLPLAVICADIGSVTQGNFGWYDGDGTQGRTPSSLAAHVASKLSASAAVALGFECPLFVPLAETEAKLTSARPGEGSRAWSAGAGCGALTTGLVQVAWVLQQALLGLSEPRRAFLSWDDFERAGSGLLLWEAFVSGTRKGVSHVEDAKLAVNAFVAALPDPAGANAVVCATPVYSLAGAALLRTGWSSDLNLLSQSCLVIKA
jgi:hypothetical protein